PGAGHAFDVGLTAQDSFRAHFAGDAGDFRGEGAQLIHEGIDGVFELEDFAFDIDRDFLGELAVGHGGGDLGDVAHLGGEVAGHGVDGIGQVLPGAGDAFDFGLAAEFAFGADLAGDAGDFGGEGTQLVDHGIHGVLELQDLTL